MSTGRQDNLDRSAPGDGEGANSQPGSAAISPWLGVPVFYLDFLAGGISGCVAKTMSAPIDRVKLLLQTQKVNPAVTTRYRGTWDCIRRVYAEQGLQSFWRGNVANLMRYFPNQALSFSFKDKFRRVMNLEGHPNNSYVIFGNLFASGAAGGAALFVLYPLDMARTRLAADVGTSLPERRYSGTLHCLRSIYAEHGVKGLYTGMSVSITGVIIFRALFMGGYDVAKQFADIKRDTAVWKKLATAQMVTLSAGTLCYPIDTVRRRVMMQAKEEARNMSGALSGVAESTPVYRSGFHAFTRIMKEEGIRGLYSGLSANLIRGVSGSVLLVGYDEIKKVFSVVTVGNR